MGPDGTLEGAEPAGQVEGAVAGYAGAHTRHLLLDPGLVFYAARLVGPRTVLLHVAGRISKYIFTAMEMFSILFLEIKKLASSKPRSLGETAPE